MNTRLILKTSSLALLISSVAWGQSTTSSIDMPSFNWRRIKDYVSPQLYYTHDYISNSGGAKAGPRNLGLLDIYLDTDLSKYSNLNGEAEFHYLHVNQNDGRGAIGDSQAASNIDMPMQVDRITDLWYQHNWESFNLKFGIQDVSMEFDITESSLNFLNSSFGIAPEFSMSGPASSASVWPITSAGVRSLYNFNDELSLRTGLYDANPGDETTYRSFHSDIGNHEGYLHVSELAHQNEEQKIGIAGWNYTNVQEKYSGNGSETSFGGYGIYERKIKHALTTFLRAGWANPKVNPVQNSFAAGVVFRGLLQKKKFEDEVGLGLTRAHMSNDYLKAEEAKSSATGNEIAYEAYYNFKPMNILTLRPDFQYITNPSGMNNLKNAWAVGLRSVIQL